MKKHSKYPIWFTTNKKEEIVDFSSGWQNIFGFKRNKVQKVLQEEYDQIINTNPIQEKKIKFVGMNFYSNGVKDIISDKDCITWKTTIEEYIEKLENKLIDQRNFFDSVFLNIITDIVIFDNKHRYLYVNNKAIKDAKTRDWIIGKTDLDYCMYKNLSIKLAEKRSEKFQKVLRSKKTTEFIDKHINKQGRDIYVHRKMHPILINEDIEYVLGIGYDITDIKELEKNLELSKREYKTLFEENVAGIFLTKLDGSFVRWNKAFEKIFGYTAKEIKNLKAESFYQKKSFRSNYIKELRENKGTLINYNLLTKHKSGTEIILNANISLMTIGQEEYLQGTIFDITEKKKIEDEIIGINKELTQKNEDLLDFNYMISHNVRSPLSNIIGLISLLENSDKEKNENHQAYLEIKKSATRLDETIYDLNSILDLKKHENNPLETVSVKRLLEKVIQGFDQQLENISLEIIQKGSDDLLINKVYLKNIFYNLISNSIKYRSQRRKSSIKISLKNSKSKFQLIVEDNGIGFDQNKYESIIFKAFKQVDKNIEGKGLGLSLIRTQVRSMGGSIKVESIEKKGTIFTIIIPHKGQ